ncbi:flagellar basal body-associated FliL family protein [Neorhizobium sp. NCHU2750]|uniref:flagellar basal body-associated FliL family protein n=1 Tax=Neorhizobium sp. NCHU2750 TaxID=1825976 RepID=UPI000E73308E|nr:flagellar basal body protein [Neorhizobium sp. NCHU2750]
MAITAEDEIVPKKKSALVPLIGALLALTVVGGAGGWFTGKLLVPAQKPAEAEAAKPAEEGAKDAKGEAGKPAAAQINLVELPPVLTNLGYPSQNVIRLQAAIVFDGAPDQAIADAINEDIVNYLRTVPLQQLQGPRGFTYLKSDLLEIAGLRSKGRVTKVLIRTFVVE